jgi:hypothetical protein
VGSLLINSAKKQIRLKEKKQVKLAIQENSDERIDQENLPINMFEITVHL